MGRYLAILLVTFATAVCGALGVATAGVALGYYDPEGDELVRERAEQLAGPPVDIAFLGDSSAGFGVEESVADVLLGRRTENLALSGSFGVAGSLEMMRRAEAALGARVFIIIHTVDILGRRTPVLVPTRATPPERRSLLQNVEMALGIISPKVLGRIVGSMVAGTPLDLPAAEFYDNQSAPAPLAALVREIEPERMASVNPDAVADLQRIADHCAARDLVCLYAHGPLWAEGCTRFAPAIAARSAIVRGMENGSFRLLADTPFCMPTAIVGNNADHVRPADDAITTRFYADLVERALALPPRRPDAIRKAELDLPF